MTHAVGRKKDKHAEGTAQPEAPYLRIASEIRRRITAGELRVGERVPSTRRIAAEWGVAIATATKALTLLRHQGLVHSLSRACTVVARGLPAQRVTPRASKQESESSLELTRDRIVRGAIALADSEGLTSLSMRGVAAKLEVPTMSLYRYVHNKEDLVLLMTDAAFGEERYPEPCPSGWRARLQIAARLQWALYRRHPWLAQVLTLTRPIPLPHVMGHAEWALASIDGLGFDATTMLHIHMTVYSYVRGIAANLESERQAEAETGITEGEWADSQTAAFSELAQSGRLPTFAKVMGELSAGYDLDLDALFEFGLKSLLDGLGALIRRHAKR